ncbi:hypothetical protein GGI43DRAFT_433484 [Trichoderma evansii]
MLVLQVIASALLFLGTASAAAIDLSERDEAVSLAKREQKITISHCTGCIAGPGGGSSCVNNWYIHWGDSKLGSCNDSSFLYNDSTCTGQMPTPSGTGTFSPSNCRAGQDQQFATVNANGNVYTCYKAAGNFSNFCGVNYACSVYASCYGP